MISAKRIVEIFRQRGGKEFANLAEQLSAGQIQQLEKGAGGRPIIAMMSSGDEWFAVTKSHFVLNHGRDLRRVPFGEIYAVAISKRYPHDVRKFEHIKTKGGDLDIELRNGTTLQVKVEPGGPYLGLMNVLMRFVAINRKRNPESKGGNAARSTTNDERPTTPL
jgi:hypothetical protein